MKNTWLLSGMLTFILGVLTMNESHASVQTPLLDSEKQALAKSAAEVRLNAYAPYSKYYVGAALLTESGKIITGCNVENAAYGSTICAERTAICKAVSDGEQTFRAVAISLKGAGSPCGSCRQVLNEFNPDMLVIMADVDGTIHRECTLAELLPYAFGPQNLN